MSERAVLKARLRASGLEPLDGISGVTLLTPLPAFWKDFKGSAEYSDGQPDPMDRYSKRIIRGIATEYEVEAAFPSDGPPYPPFLAWADQADGIFHSPIGLIVHTHFGLWVSFRGALFVDLSEGARTSLSPCASCAKPCETACPVDAFAGGFDVDKCRDHLRSGAVACWQGCLARRVCPANKIPRDPAQSEFHMRAFVE